MRKEKSNWTVNCLGGQVSITVIAVLGAILIVLGGYIYFNLHKTRIELDSCRSSCSIRD